MTRMRKMPLFKYCHIGFSCGFGKNNFTIEYIILVNDFTEKFFVQRQVARQILQKILY